jgi:mRNA interferase MazF
MALSRGAIVVVASRGAYTGKPRPALVVQSDLFNETHASVTICPITSDRVDAPLFRLTVPAGSRTGLRRVSQIMVDKIVTVPRTSVGGEIGRCDPAELEAVEEALRLWLGME